MSDHIRRYWNAQAEEHGLAHSASWGDSRMIDLEIQTIGSHIRPGDCVLDAGCANGYSTLRQLERGPLSIVGIDFSEEMVERANTARAQIHADDDVRFEVGDIRSLPFEDQQFDVVYTTRVLINLPTWDEQMRGAEECLRVCKKGGTVVFSEGFWEPLVLLNAMRALVSRPALVEQDFNRYLKKAKLEDFLRARRLEYEAIDFSSIYYLGTRFLRELVAPYTTEASDYEHPINEVFYQLEREYSGEGFGIQQAYVVENRASE